MLLEPLKPNQPKI